MRVCWGAALLQLGFEERRSDIRVLVLSMHLYLILGWDAEIQVSVSGLQLVH